MFGAILRFELGRQLRRPVTWFVFLAFAATGVLEMIGPGVRMIGAHDGVFRNAPMVIVNAVTMFCVLAALAAGTFAAAAALRDHDHRTAEMILSQPVGRRAYIGGRFVAAWLLVLLTMLACMAGIATGLHLPGWAATSADVSGAVAYPWAFAVIVLPGTLFMTALLFGVAIFTRSLLATFVTVAALVVLLILSHAFMRDLGGQMLGAVLDPFGYHTLKAVARYWPAAEFNTRLPTIGGWLLVNRLLWTGLALVVLGLLLTLRWNLLGIHRTRRTGSPPVPRDTPDAAVRVPKVIPRWGWGTAWKQFVHWLVFDARRVLRGAPFLVLLLFALICVAGNLVTQPTLLGVTSYPLTAALIPMIVQNLSWLLAITLVFYAGDLVWRDRDLHVAEVCDATPWTTGVAVAAKICVLAIVVVVFLACGGLVGIAWQLLHGYTRIEPGLYLVSLALAAVPYVLLAALCVVVQVACGQRFVGYLLTVAWLLLVRIGARVLGWTDHLFLYGTTPPLPHSALNGYGRFLGPVLWFDAYWSALALALLAVAALLWVRGTGGTWRGRAREALGRLHWPTEMVLAIALAAFAACGAWIFHNTHGVNHVVDVHRGERQLADYEKAYAQYRHLPQPNITREKLAVAMYPHRHALDIRGRYTLVNHDDKPIRKLLVAYPAGFSLTSVSLPPHDVVSRRARPHFVVYRLHKPLAPGASMRFGFRLHFAAHGFRNAPRDTFLVANGSFFDNVVGADRTSHNVLPHIGYQPYLELTNPRVRRAFDLPAATSVMGAPGDAAARQVSAISGDAGWVHADITLSTAKNQTAITSGALERTWVKDGRCYFHYVSRVPLPNMLPFLSARYAVRHAHWHGVAIDVYYDPRQAWNVDRMIHAVRDALAWDSRHFGAYPRKEMRVAVIPYNKGFAAQSFPGVLVVRESGPAGPQAQPARKGAIDPVYQLLAHEVSHQWWAYQEQPANMRGLNMITESLAQYSTLMLLKQHYGEKALQPVLLRSLNGYLQGRRRTSVPESPLVDVGDVRQGYIYYKKGVLVFYALQDYLGEATVNHVLRQFLDATRFRPAPYATSRQFLALLDAAAGAKWQPLVDDLFRRITLFDNRMTSAKATRLPDGDYRVTLHVHAAEYHVDGKGTKTPMAIDIPVGIAVYARNGDGETALYSRKYPLHSGDSSITVTVHGKPYAAAIDPSRELVDMNTHDNRATVVVP